MENRRSLSAGTLKGDRVRNLQGEDLGKVEEIMLDVHSGCVSYVVLSHGGILGMGDKLFAIPWKAMTLDMDSHEFVLDMSLERFENAPGFEKTDWPDFSSSEYGQQIHNYYGVEFPSWFSSTGMTGMGTASDMREGTMGGAMGTSATYGTEGSMGNRPFGTEGFREGQGFSGEMMDCDEPGLTEDERQRCRDEKVRAA